VSETRQRVEIAPVAYDAPDASELIEELQQEYVVRYGGNDATPITHDEFAAPTGLFLVARVDGEPGGCGAFRRHGGPGSTIAEIKRMYVRPQRRGSGLADQILAELEARAVAAGYQRMILESGGAQPEAMAFYQRCGYTEIEPFGYYKDSDQNHCYGKDL
jgi:GNAT superfamily N-acetyltransferase